jgi:N-acetylmuramoyl-L-alanine amidase
MLTAFIRRLSYPRTGHGAQLVNNAFRRALLVTLALAASAVARAEDLSVVLNGQYRDPVNAYKIGESYFLSAKDAGQLYGGQVYWYPVSGRLQFSLRGRALQFQVGSEKVQVGKDMVTLDGAVMLRTSLAFVPLTFFETEEFSEWAGADTTFNPRTKLVTIDKRASIGGLRWFSYGDYTRVSVELKPGVSYAASARGVGGIEVSFPLASLEGSERGEIEDGLVGYYSLTQGSKAAKLTVKFGKRGLKWQAKELKNPRRLVVDVFKADVVPTPDGERSETKPREPVAKAETPEVRPSPAKQPETKPVKSIGPVIAGKGRRRIVVDAGHGGKDPGATGRSGTQEKDINLRAALELADLLKEEGTFEVMLTRGDDTFVPLADRSRLANEFGADLFVSLHCNASRHPKDNGFEVYFLSENATDPAAQEIADFENSVVELEGKTPQDAKAEMLLMEMSKTENINSASELAALTARDLGKRVDLAANGVKQAGFYVLRGTHAPAILFEMAYISNKKDEAKLQSKKYRRKLVDGVYAGILAYAKRQGWTTGAGR